MSQTQKDRIIQQAIDDMVWVEGGTFTMGATSEQGRAAGGDEKPAHQVTLSGFYISKYEVTQELWQAVMGSTVRQLRATQHDTSTSLSGEGANYPMYYISWDDCQKFVRRLNKLTGKKFRLPTEAEWEFAARGGNQSKGYKYAGSNDIDEVAWYKDNSGKTAHPVGQKLPNELGLYDMSGNECEWCQDSFGSYSIEPQTNPQGPSGLGRVGHGGSWNCPVYWCRVSCRQCDNPSNRYHNRGMRLAM